MRLYLHMCLPSVFLHVRMADDHGYDHDGDAGADYACSCGHTDKKQQTKQFVLSSWFFRGIIQRKFRRVGESRGVVATSPKT